MASRPQIIYRIAVSRLSRCLVFGRRVVVEARLQSIVCVLVLAVAMMLSSVASAQNANHLSRQDIEAHAIEDDAVSERLGNILKLDVGTVRSVSHRQQHGMRGDSRSTVC